MEALGGRAVSYERGTPVLPDQCDSLVKIGRQKRLRQVRFGVLVADQAGRLIQPGRPVPSKSDVSVKNTPCPVPPGYQVRFRRPKLESWDGASRKFKLEFPPGPAWFGRMRASASSVPP